MDLEGRSSIQQPGGVSPEPEAQLCPPTSWPALRGDDTYTVAEAIESTGKLVLKLSSSGLPITTLGFETCKCIGVTMAPRGTWK